MNATTTEIDNALSFLDMCDMACKLTPTVTFGSGYGRGHTVMLDLVEFMID